MVCPGGKQCVVRPPSEKPSDFLGLKIAWLLGGTFTVLSLAHLLRQRDPRCWLCWHVAAGLTVQQSKCLALLSITWWALGSRNAPRGFHQVPEERFQQSDTLSSMRVLRGWFARFTSGPDCTVGARLHRRGLIGPDCAVAGPTSWRRL